MKEFSHKTRSLNLSTLKTETFDVLIVGGGITGAGIARDAASRGMKVGLIEASDYSSGTSSRSSKLIHGGIRYLEHLEFGLVFEALSERRLLFEIAPHLVHPLRFVLPLYEGGRVGMFKMGLGMWLYDLLSLFDAPESHQRFDAKQTLEILPTLKQKGLLGSFAYYDAYMDDDRLVHETLRSANELGAVCVNYVEALHSDKELNGRVSSLRVKDKEGGEEFDIKARHFVSAVGPWTDIFGQRIFARWKNVMRPSKGIHLTFHKSRLPMSDAVVMAADKDERIVFGIPRHEMVILGTTDTDFKGNPGRVKTNREDVDYLLKIANEYFPGARLEEKDILASYSGIRPLIHDGSQSESATSREHLIFTEKPNVTFVAGGKYTTYRRMAEQTMQEVLNCFEIEEQIKFGKNDTKKPLNPACAPEVYNKLSGQLSNRLWQSIPINIRQWLAERHGEESFRLFNLWGEYPHYSDEVQMWCIDALHAIVTTQCLHLRDYVLRRSPLMLSRQDHGRSLWAPLAEVFQHHLGWSEQQKKAEMLLLESHIEIEMGWRAMAGSSSK